MSIRNKYCTRCFRTEHMEFDGEKYTCPGCLGVFTANTVPNRDMIGCPWSGYRTSFAESSGSESISDKKGSGS